MERRAAGALLALAACLACSAAAPTSSNHTSLDVYDGATEGCYYNFQHYGEGDRIMTNEPCLNCTCHNRMLMCYLRVCPFTKPIGQDCTVEKRADQCCPIVTCPDVPVDLLTSTSTTSPQEYGGTGVGKLDKYGCSINGKFLPEGAKVPSSPDKPCEHCYCFRNVTNCIMQECTLHVDGCTPIYHRDACCPVRYSCDHPEDETLMLDDMTTTVRPTPGFLLTTTTLSPVTQMSQDCVHDDQIFADGALIKTEKACEHCYCMKGDIVCVVQECGTPMENEGKNCTSLAPREGQCCPDTYICEGDELPTTDIITETTKEYLSAETTTLLPPKRLSIEGSGYRNEPDDTSFLGISTSEPEIEGSGDEIATKSPIFSDANVIDDHGKPQQFDHNEDVATDDMLIFSSTTPPEILPKVTTEPDKGLNTVPISEDDIDQSVPEKTTPSYELATKHSEEVFVTTEITRRKENDVTTTANAFTNDAEQIQTTTVSSELLEDHATNVISEKETKATTAVPIHEDDKKEKLTTPASDNLNILETSTIADIDDSKIDTENKIEATTPNAMDNDKENEEKVQSEATTADALDIIKNIEDHMQTEVTTHQTINDEDKNELEKTTTSAIPDVKVIDETTTIPALDSVKEGENIKHFATTISSSIDNSKEDEEKLQSESTTLSALDDLKENEQKIHSTPTTTTSLDSDEIKHSASTTKSPISMDIETEEAIQSTSHEVTQDTTQSEVTTKGTSDSFVNDDDNMKSQATTASDIDNTKKDDQKPESVATTPDSVMEQEDKNEYEATTTSGVNVVKEDNEKVKPDTTTQEAPNDVSEVTATIDEVIIKQKKDQVQPESTTQGSLKDVQENDVQPDTTTAPHFGEDNDNKENIDIATTSASPQDNDVVKDVDTIASEGTQSTLDTDKQDEVNIQSDVTTLNPLFGVKDEEKIQSEFTTHSIIESEKENEDVITIRPTTEGPKEEEVNKQSETTTVGSSASVEGEYERDTPVITTQSSTNANEKGDDDQNLKSEATTSTMELQTSSAIPVESFTERNEEKTQFEATTANVIENVEENGEKVESLATTVSSLDTDKENTEIIQSEATTASDMHDIKKDERFESDATTISAIGTVKEDQELIKDETTTSRVKVNEKEESETTNQYTTISLKDEENRMGSESTTVSMTHILKDEDQDKVELEATTTRDVNVAEEEKDKMESEDTTVSTIVDSKGDVDRVESEVTTVKVFDDINEGEQTITTQKTQEEEKDIDNSIKPDGVTQSTVDSEKIETETTSSILVDVKQTDETTQSTFTTAAVSDATSAVTKLEGEVDIDQSETTAKTYETKPDLVSTYQSTTTALPKIYTTEPVTEGKDFVGPETITTVPDIHQFVTQAHTTTELEDSLETSSMNPVENEIDDSLPLIPPGRIPGEGDCLLNGVTYQNDTAIPNISKCHSNCRCFSSIIKCDPIICSQPPENMDNCQPIYDSDDSCCPSYTCDQTKETIPPQSHSQMSGTESPVVTSNKICNDGKCDATNEEKLQTPSPITEIPQLCSGNECVKPQSDTVVPSCNGNNCEEVQPPIPTKYDHQCEGNECQQENHDYKPCDGDNCLPQQSVDSLCKSDNCESSTGKTHIAPIIPDATSCNGSPCESETIQPHKTEDSPCTDEIGCKQPSEQEIQSECTGSNCRRVEIAEPEQNVSAVCQGNACTQSSTEPGKYEDTSPQAYTPTKSYISDKTDDLSESYSTGPAIDDKMSTIVPQITTLQESDLTPELIPTVQKEVTKGPISEDGTFTESPYKDLIDEKTEQPLITDSKDTDTTISDSHHISTMEPAKEIETVTLNPQSKPYGVHEGSTESSLATEPDNVKTTISDIAEPSYQSTSQEGIIDIKDVEDPEKNAMETSSLPGILHHQDETSTSPDSNEPFKTVSDLNIIEAVSDRTTKSPEVETTEAEGTIELVTKNPQFSTDFSISDKKEQTTPVSETTVDTKLSTTDSSIISEGKPTDFNDNQEKEITTVQPEILQTTEKLLDIDLTKTTKQESLLQESPEPQQTQSTITSFTSDKEYTTTMAPLSSNAGQTEENYFQQNEVSADLPISTESTILNQFEHDSSQTTTPLYLPDSENINKVTPASVEISVQTEFVTDKISHESPLTTDDYTHMETSPQQETSSSRPESTTEIERASTTEKTAVDVTTKAPEIVHEYNTSPPSTDSVEKEIELDPSNLITTSPVLIDVDNESTTPSQSLIETESQHPEYEKPTEKIIENVPTTEKSEDESDKLKPDISDEPQNPIDIVTNGPDYDVTVQLKDEKDATSQSPNVSQETVTSTIAVDMKIESTTPTLIHEISSELPKVEIGTSDSQQPTTTTSDILINVTEKELEIPVSITTDSTILQTVDSVSVDKDDEIRNKLSSASSSSTTSGEILSENVTLLPELMHTTTATFNEPSEEKSTKTPSEFDSDTQSKTTIPDSTVKDKDGSEMQPIRPESTPADVSYHKTDFTKLEQTTVYAQEETTPYLVELEEHTHKIMEDTTTTAPGSLQYDELTTIQSQPETDVEVDTSTVKQSSESQTTDGDLKVSVSVGDSESPVTETIYHTSELPDKSGLENKFTSPTATISPASEPPKETDRPNIYDKDKTEIPTTSETSFPEEEITKETSKPHEEIFTQQSPIANATTLKDQLNDVTTPMASTEPPKHDVHPTDELPTPDYDAHLPSAGTSGYGQEPDYVEEDQAFGPGTCRYGGKVYVSAQQIPRDDPCDFCFCFRSDIICLQQSCPPPIQGCHEEPIQGFCCPRYECPVAMATTLNMTTTTTTTTTTLPPHFPTHAYSGSAQRRGCQIKGHIYKVGEVVKASSGPCLHCTCGGDGQMKCDPKVCTPEPMLRQMIAAAVSAKRRR